MNRGHGFFLDKNKAVITGDEYTVWGLGPNSYWDDFAEPIGDDGVTITIVNCGGEEPRYVAITIILVDQTTIELRDPTTCSPLWRSQGCREVAASR